MGGSGILSHLDLRNLLCRVNSHLRAKLGQLAYKLLIRNCIDVNHLLGRGCLPRIPAIQVIDAFRITPEDQNSAHG
jgi:hypothetical protein